jgi:hypothetical protein
LKEKMPLSTLKNINQIRFSDLKMVGYLF